MLGPLGVRLEHTSVPFQGDKEQVSPAGLALLSSPKGLTVHFYCGQHTGLPKDYFVVVAQVERKAFYLNTCDRLLSERFY